MSRVGERIKEARLSSKMSQKTLAKKLGVAEKFLNDVELGRKVIQEALISRASKVLNVDLNDISMVATDEDLMEEIKTSRYSTAEPKKAKEDKANDVWENAFSSVLKNVPIYDYSLKNVSGSRELPIHSNKVLGYHQDKVIYLEISNDEMTGFRMCKGDLAFGHLVNEFLGNGFYLVSIKGENKIREIKKLDGSKVLLMSNMGSLMTETMEFKNLKVLAKLERIEITL